MSTISITAPTRLRMTRLRITTRGRRVLAALVALPLAAGIGFVAISGGTAIASGDSVETATFETITVLPGATLWSIAESLAPSSDPRTVIGEIERLNLLRSGSLQAGQELAIPAQYTN